jgi:hypothetical protein
LSVTKAQISEDKTRVFLTVDGMEEKSVVHVSLGTLTSQSGSSLLYKDGWYTLNYFSNTPFSSTTNLVPAAELRRVNSDLMVHRRSGAIDLEWISDYSVLSVHTLDGSVERTFEVSGRKRFHWSDITNRKGLYLLKLQGKQGSALAKVIL